MLISAQFEKESVRIFIFKFLMYFISFEVCQVDRVDCRFSISTLWIEFGEFQNFSHSKFGNFSAENRTCDVVSLIVTKMLIPNFIDFAFIWTKFLIFFRKIYENFKFPGHFTLWNGVSVFCNMFVCLYVYLYSRLNRKTLVHWVLHMCLSVCLFI